MRTAPNAAISGMVVMLGMLSPGTVQAAEITVLASQGVVSAVRDLAPAFERASGHKVVVSFEPRPRIMVTIAADIAAAISPYSTAVAPLSSQANRASSTFMVRNSARPRYG